MNLRALAVSLASELPILLALILHPLSLRHQLHPLALPEALANFLLGAIKKSSLVKYPYLKLFYLLFAF